MSAQQDDAREETANVTLVLKNKDSFTPEELEKFLDDFAKAAGIPREKLKEAKWEAVPDDEADKLLKKPDALPASRFNLDPK